MFAYSNFSRIPRRELLKRALFLFFIISFSSTLLSSEKYFDRNQLPQLSQEILDDSQFSYTKEVVKADSITPVQTQRVRAFKLLARDKSWLLEDRYNPLIIDIDNYLIDGHHRLDGIKELGIKEVRVLRVNATIEEVIEAFDEYRDFNNDCIPTYEPEKINSVSIERHFLVSISDTSRKIIVRIAEWLESQWILML